MMISNKSYNFLKWVALVLLPAIVVFVFAITKIWGLPYGPEIAGTVSAIDALLGALLQVSTKSYNTKIGTGAAGHGYVPNDINSIK